MAVSEDDLKERIEREVRDALARISDSREAAVIDTINKQRDFLVSNTKWVVGGFFGLLIIFSALITFLFGTQLEDKYIDSVIGASISEKINKRIDVRVKEASREALDVVENSIDQKVDLEIKSAEIEISTAIDTQIDKILTSEVKNKIDEAVIAFSDQTPLDILSRIIPVGTVIALDNPNLSSDECPDGWEPFRRGRGRMIVGAGDPAGVPGEFGFGEDGQQLSRRDLRQLGGAETHRLIIFEMPRHTHSVSDPGHDHGSPVHSSNGGNSVGWNAIGGTNHTDYEQTGRRSSGIKVRDAGSGEPHNNMPPYIALNFCKKKVG